MQLNTQTTDDVLIIHVDEHRIDASVAIQFKDTVRGLIADGPKQVLLDLARVDFLDSSGLGAVVAVMKHLGKDRQLILSGLTPNVAKVFRLTRMDRVFRIHDSVDDALGAPGAAA